MDTAFPECYYLQLLTLTNFRVPWIGKERLTSMPNFILQDESEIFGHFNACSFQIVHSSLDYYKMTIVDMKMIC